jgi:hypothetical protein
VSPPDRKGLAVLKLPRSDLSAARLGDSSRLVLQSPFGLLCYPREATSVGHVVSYETWKDGSPVLGTDLKDGCRGPAVNELGEIVGMVASSPPDSRDQGFPPVFLRPANDIKEFLRAAGIEPAAAEGQKDLYEEAMDDFWAAVEDEEEGRIGAARKSYGRAARTLRQKVAEDPEHLEADFHLRQATNRLDRLPRGME